MFRATAATVAAFVIAASSVACRDQEVSTPPTDPRPAASGSTAKPPNPPTPVVEIPLGELAGGTRPGRFERNPALEPVSFRIKLGPFEIDRGPYPNLPDKPPLLGASLEEASRLCGETGARLCTELEWERACRGPNADAFAGGAQWDQECSGSCASGFGVEHLGRYPEYTASVFGPRSTAVGQPVLRGPSTEPATDTTRRCAHRSLLSQPAPKGVAFRCCRGAPNAARVPEPVDGPVFEKRSLEPDALRKLLSAHPKTADLANDLVLFGEPEAVNTVISRGPGDRMGFDFTTSPLLWRPTLGAEFLVLAAKSGKHTSFVLSYHVIGDDYELASSFVMRGEAGPVILAYSPSIRPRLHFSSCWGCPGENGKILFREPDRAVVLQP